MLTVTNLLGQTEVITNFNNFEMVEELNGGFTLSFSSFSHPENLGHNLIDQESIVEYDGYEFRIKQLRSTLIAKQVTAISTYFDNVDNRKYDMYGGTHTFDEFATYALANTGWTFINEDMTESVLIPNFGNDNVVKLIDVLKAAFECEMKIEPNRVLHFAKQLGPDNDDQYRYGHNILAISENIDTTKLKTYIEGFGASGVHVTYTSPLASSPGIGIRHADPIYNDDITSEEAMLEFIMNELHDYPDSTIELDAIELQEKEIGECVWLIHERMGIEYQTRVMAKHTKIPRMSSSVVLGNTQPQTISGLLASQKVEIDRSKKETRSRFEQTNEQISMVVTRVDSAESAITQTAEEIDLKVSKDNLISSINLSTEGIKLDGSIIDLSASTEFVSKVGKDGVISAINQTPEVIMIDASKINLIGAVTFSSLGEGLQYKVTAGEDAKSFVDNWKYDSTHIDGNKIYTGTITADKIDVNDLKAERIIAPYYNSNYIEVGGSSSWFDTTFYKGGSEIFQIYDAGTGIEFRSYGVSFLRYDAPSQKAWIKGIDVIAKFG